MIIKTAQQRQDLIEGGKRLGEILRALRDTVAPGITAEDLDDMAEHLIREGGDTPSFLGYTPEGASRPFPASLCVSINDEVVHGIPNEGVKTLKEGDIVGLDLGLTHNGIIVDAAITVPVGTVSAEMKKLLSATEESLMAGIAAAAPGKHIGDIGHAIEESLRPTGFSVVKVLSGHGVGDRVHEWPDVPNYGKPGEGPEIEEGMVLALEPIANTGRASVILAPDGYTFRTKDGSRSAHFEHTILIEKGGARIVTA